MHWLLQRNALSRELDLFETITGTLDRGGVPWTAVRALSFTDKIVDADEDVNGKELEDIPEIAIDVQGPIVTGFGTRRTAVRPGRAQRDQGPAPTGDGSPTTSAARRWRR